MNTLYSYITKRIQFLTGLIWQNKYLQHFQKKGKFYLIEDICEGIERFADDEFCIEWCTCIVCFENFTFINHTRFTYEISKIILFHLHKKKYCCISAKLRLINHAERLTDSTLPTQWIDLVKKFNSPLGTLNTQHIVFLWHKVTNSICSPQWIHGNQCYKERKYAHCCSEKKQKTPAKQKRKVNEK